MNRSIRWAVRGTLILGVAASVTANVLHARDNPISQTIAGWPPLALLITVEVVARVPIVRRWLGLVRVLGVAVIAGIAAWVSYWHMAGVALRYGEATGAAHLLPLSVDGLIVVASVCLVELGGRIRTAEDINEGEGDGAVQQQRQAEAEQRDSIERQLHTDGPDHSEAAQGDGVAAADRQEDPRETAEVAPAQIEPTKPPARKPHTTNPDRVRRAYERNPEADPKVVAGRLNLSLATVKKYRPPKEQPGAGQRQGAGPGRSEVMTGKWTKAEWAQAERDAAQQHEAHERWLEQRQAESVAARQGTTEGTEVKAKQ